MLQRIAEGLASFAYHGRLPEETDCWEVMSRTGQRLLAFVIEAVFKLALGLAAFVGFAYVLDWLQRNPLDLEKVMTFATRIFDAVAGVTAEELIAALIITVKLAVLIACLFVVVVAIVVCLAVVFFGPLILWHKLKHKVKDSCKLNFPREEQAA